MQSLVDGARPATDGHHSKKKSLSAAERETPRVDALRQHFRDRQGQLDPSKLIFLDEAGSHIAMTPDYAWAPRGERITDTVPRNRGTVTTMIGALTVAGLVAMMTVEGATDADVFPRIRRAHTGPQAQAR